MTTLEIMIKAEDTVSIASLINATANKAAAAITPVLGEINLELINGNLTATATDRCMAATYATTATGEDTTFRLTAAAAKFLAANVKRVNKHYETPPVSFLVDVESRRVTIEHGGASFTDTWYLAKYPGVLSLLDTWQPAAVAQPVKLRAEFLARLHKFVDAFIRVDYWIMELGISGGSYKPERPGPVMATAGKFRVLVQPNNYAPGESF